MKREITIKRGDGKTRTITITKPGSVNNPIRPTKKRNTA